jgi:hypothetical protein
MYDEKTKERPGQTIRAEVVKNKTYRPFQKATWDFLWTEEGSGKFDVIGGTVDELKTLGTLESAGAYIVWDGKKYYRKALVEKIEAEGLKGKLFDLLPEDE